ncbi:hypothetical protein [Pseudomonas yamanorum]
MQSVLVKAFGGLTTSYYIRQLLFGLIFAVLFIAMLASSPGGVWAKSGMIVFALICSLLYPYSRFVYESIVGYIMGENVFFVNALLMLAVKVFTMSLCWSLAIFIAPVGLVYLFFRNLRAAT